jgi:hypothetical protein
MTYDPRLGYDPANPGAAPPEAAWMSDPANPLRANPPMPPPRPTGLGQAPAPAPAINPAATVLAPPQSTTPQGWNLFTALGNALGNLGRNFAGQPQGMSGLVRNPPSALRMPNSPADRWQGRTLIG